uniref:Uncharacterized protein n=1 Tax=Anguilla anguilla TaxID=7936 RepID=A0A0E9RJC4_ANGAN
MSVMAGAHRDLFLPEFVCSGFPSKGFNEYPIGSRSRQRH